MKLPKWLIILLLVILVIFAIFWLFSVLSFIMSIIGIGQIGSFEIGYFTGLVVFGYLVYLGIKKLWQLLKNKK